LEVAVAEPERIEALILGSGEGGKYLAWHLAKSGRRAVVVERRWIGGSCPNINCLPSKNEIWSAKVVDLARRAGEFGAMTGPITIDITRVRQRKRDMVDGLIAMHLQNYKASGAELIMGSGRFVLISRHWIWTICRLIWSCSAAAMSAWSWRRLIAASEAA
jgi:pyruvate/2-oxoglutarate dehydrogenase complex dihydrolipoamide dehydrogenase (E3) component